MRKSKVGEKIVLEFDNECEFEQLAGLVDTGVRTRDYHVGVAFLSVLLD